MDRMRQVITLFAHCESSISAQPQLRRPLANKESAAEAVARADRAGCNPGFRAPSPQLKAFAVRQAGSLMSASHALDLIAIAKINQHYMEVFEVPTCWKSYSWT
jgi:hypothetical protein